MPRANITSNAQAERVLYGLRMRAEDIAKTQEFMVAEQTLIGLRSIRKQAHELHRWAIALENYLWSEGTVDFARVAALHKQAALPVSAGTAPVTSQEDSNA